MVQILKIGALIIICGCSTSPKTELLEIHQEICKKYFYQVSETQFVRTDAFELNFPINWYYIIEKSQDGNTTYVFSEKLDSTNNFELTNEQFNDKFNNFETISLTYSTVYPGMNYSESYKVAINKLKKDKLVEITNEGRANYQNEIVNWTSYIDRRFEKNELICQSFTTCIYNDKYYVWITQQTLGCKDNELRKCKSIEILKTIKLNV
ncbi:MAG: hypothetical protein KA536_11630 [Saprospiraceae bacterium]|jgi:hypothetical protein|nr:hypothetical protein [Saprospiraceae bacterium]